MAPARKARSSDSIGLRVRSFREGNRPARPRHVSRRHYPVCLLTDRTKAGLSWMMGIAINGSCTGCQILTRTPAPVKRRPDMDARQIGR